MGSAERPRVAIVYPRANLDTVPSLFNAAELLDRHGYGVDLFVRTAPSGEAPRFASPGIRLRSLGAEVAVTAPPSGLRHALRRTGRLGQAVRGPLTRGYLAVGALAHRAAATVDARSRRLTAALRRERLARCYIGVDFDGLSLASDLAGGSAPTAYYSLELLLSGELRSDGDRRAKQRERALSRQAAFVVVQDPERARLLAEDNGIPLERMVLVPNAPLGPARRQRSPYWHERLGLDPDQRVVLHSGSLGGWTGIREIVDSVPTWPRSWVLVVHTRYDAESSAYVEELKGRAAPGRVFFSLTPVPRQEYDRLVDGADLGLAFYVRTDESALTGQNVATIGLSSGKIAYALRAGLPVIVNRAASLGEVLERAGCGVAVRDAAGIGAAIARIEADSDTFSRQACLFFERHLDFARGFDGVIQRIDSLARQGAAR